MATINRFVLPCDKVYLLLSNFPCNKVFTTTVHHHRVVQLFVLVKVVSKYLFMMLVTVRDFCCRPFQLPFLYSPLFYLHFTVDDATLCLIKYFVLAA